MKSHHFGWGIGVAVLLALTSFSVAAQNVSDALRYSLYTNGGSARYVGVGSSMSAIGADLSAVNTNPAGIALFRKSEYAFTPALSINDASSQLLSGQGNGINTDNRTVFNLPNAGVVFTSRPRSPGWKAMNFALTANQLANFNQQFYVQGSSVGTLAQHFKEVANSSVGLNDFETKLASDASSIYDFQGDGVYDIDYDLSPKALLSRSQKSVTKGSMTELGLTFAGNYNEKVMIGLTVGIPFFSYSSDKTYVEQDVQKDGGNVPYFSDLSYREKLTTTGSGINAKLGVIFRPTQVFRIGASIQTPTAIMLSDSYSSTLINNYYEDVKETGKFLGQQATSTGNFDYKLKTPWRYTGSAGLVFGKSGFFSAEVEYVDYSHNNFRYSNFADAQKTVNTDISNQLQSVLNVRLGTEIAVNIFRFRAGIGLTPSPFLNDDTRQYTYSGGFGIREKAWYLDFGYRRTQNQVQYYPYLTQRAPIQEVKNSFKNSQFLMTLGLKF